MFRGDRRQIQELKQYILEGQHPRLRELGGKGIGSDLCVRAGKSSVQRGLSGIGRTEQGDLRRAFAPDGGQGSGMGRPRLGTRELLGELLDARLDVRL